MYVYDVQMYVLCMYVCAWMYVWMYGWMHGCMHACMDVCMNAYAPLLTTPLRLSLCECVSSVQVVDDINDFSLTDPQIDRLFEEADPLHSGCIARLAFLKLVKVSTVLCCVVL